MLLRERRCQVLVVADEKIGSVKAEGKDVATSQEGVHASIRLSVCLWLPPFGSDKIHQ